MFCEIDKHYDGKYYAKVFLNGTKLEDIPQGVCYRALREIVLDRTKVELPMLKALRFYRVGHLRRAHINNFIVGSAVAYIDAETLAKAWASPPGTVTCHNS